jgi:hypothetical protein
MAREAIHDECCTGYGVESTVMSVRTPGSILTDLSNYMELGADFTVSVYTVNSDRSYIETSILALYDDGISIKGDDDQPVLVYLANIVSIEINERT